MLRRIFWACAASLALSTPLKAADDLVTTYALDNGMQVVVVEDHRAPVVMHMVWYKAGSADEQPGVSGIAHFLEHLLFKGTKTMAPGEFSATVAANGGRDNAFTSYDVTAYHQRVASDRLELMMRMESDRMVNLQLAEEDILTERDVIIEERNQRVENSPGALFREQLTAAQYLNHRYGVPVIGWRHEMVALDLEDALAFYETYYAPNNAVLIVAGDVEPEAVKALADQYYGVIPANPDLGPRMRPSEPPQLSPRRMVFHDPRVAQPYVARSYLAPERNSGDQRTAAALTLLAELLGGGQTSVLSQKLQFETKESVYAGSWYRGTSLDATTFNLVMVPAQGIEMQAAEDALDRAVAEFMQTGVDEAHLERIKMQLRASQIYERDSVESVANRYGRGLTSGLTIADIQAWPDVLQSITSAEIMAAAEEVFDLRNSVTGWLMTEEQEQEVSQ
jgi:zinc protease